MFRSHFADYYQSINVYMYFCIHASVRGVLPQLALLCLHQIRPVVVRENMHLERFILV